jgi:hypothetical protein
MTTPPVPKVFQKAIGAYLKEANALQAHDPLMAFYCTFFFGPNLDERAG